MEKISTETWNKLVRDNIVPQLEKRGIRCEWRELSDEEMIFALEAKLEEEYLELKRAENPNAKLEEIIDMVTILVELANRLGADYQVIDDQATAKMMDKGGFKKNIFLISTTERIS